MGSPRVRPVKAEKTPARLLVVGLGNPLMGDDGVGHAVVECLKRNGVPEGVRVEALAGDVLGLADLWRGETDLWLVDGVDGGSAAGSVQVLDHDALLDLPVDNLAAHHMSVSESLRWLLHGKPEMAEIRFRLYGIEVESIQPASGLSPIVAAAVGPLVESLNIAASA